MSQLNCEACAELRVNAASFVQNGVTTSICNSMANDTGINSSLSPKHTDAQDLHTANDCLIGKMSDDIETYDLCEWQDFMKKHLANLHELLKLMICAIGGIWTKIHNHETRIGDLETRMTNAEGEINDLWTYAESICDKVESIGWPSLVRYGTLPYNSDTDRKFGSIVTKNGQPLVTYLAEADYPDRYTGAVGIGIRYLKKRSMNCSEQCRTYEWLALSMYGVYLGSNVAAGDVLWHCTKAAVQAATGMSETMWDNLSYSQGGHSWHDVPLSDNSMGIFAINVDEPGYPNELVIRYLGTVYPVHDASGRRIGDRGNGEYTVISSC